MKQVLLLLAFMIAFAPQTMAQDGLYIGGHQMDERELAQSKRQIEEMKRDLNKNYYIYNSDEGFYVGRGLPSRAYNYNQRNDHDILSACSGLSERKFRRCVDDAVKAKQKLIKKYRN